MRSGSGEPLLECGYYEAGQCRSCELITTPQDQQLAAKDARARELLGSDAVWLPPVPALRENFRNKVKLVVTGTVAEPHLGILEADLRDCPLPTTGIRVAIAPIAHFISECELVPYNPETDTGVLKYVIITESPNGELMIRFVVRRRGVQGILFKRIDRLHELVPNARVVTMNVQPERKAILEGEEEILISGESLPMQLLLEPELAGERTPIPLLLELLPRSFFQTNTAAAEVLYTRAIEWIAELGGPLPTAWDLYCGVGGFALALAQAGVVRDVVGVETSADAVAAATRAAQAVANEAARSPDTAPARFEVADALEWVRDRTVPDVVVVNPPRRGIGKLASWLEESGVTTVLYSSCNADSLTKDVARMPSMRLARAQVVDMFPHTKHFETIVLLTR